MISCDICEMAEFLEWRTASSLLGVRNIGLREQEMVQPQMVGGPSDPGLEGLEELSIPPPRNHITSS